MSVPSEIELGGLAALGAIGSVCAILLRSTHQNLKTLDIMRRDAAAASERLRQELRHNDNTIFKLQGMCADYRYTIAKLEAELLHRASSGYGSQAKQTHESNDPKPPSRLGGSTSARPNPEEVLE